MHIRLAPLERPAKAAAVAITVAFAVVGIVIDVIVLGRVQPGLDAVGRLAPTSSLAAPPA